MDFTHFDERGGARMVDVGSKQPTHRTATAEGFVFMHPDTLRLVKTGGMKKGDVLGVARIAGIMAAKKTAEIIPLCHPVPIDGITVDLECDEHSRCVRITATVRCYGVTGVEMEALTAVSAAALTVYDMCKAVEKGISICDVRLVSKTGGKSGDYYR